MKCYTCICGIMLPEGIWCVRFKGLATEEMASKCRKFVDKRCLKGFKE